MRYGKMHQQAIAMVEFLAAHPDSTAREVCAAVRFTNTMGNVVHYVRNIAGEEVLTCRYDRGRRSYVYRLATDSAEGIRYVGARKVKLRNESANLVAMCDRMTAKFGPDPEVTMARALLGSIVTILDASNPPPSLTSV